MRRFHDIVNSVLLYLCELHDDWAVLSQRSAWREAISKVLLLVYFVTPVQMASVDGCDWNGGDTSIVCWKS